MEKYKKEKLGWGSIQLGMYPVYVNSVYEGREPLKIVGIRENEVELEGDYSGGTHDVTQKQWFKTSDCFVLYSVCEQQLKPNGCQVHNVNCCGGGSLQLKHIDKYWENLI